MTNFLMIELPFIFVSIFVLGVFLFIATRSFISPLVMKRGLIPLILIMAFGIGAHYNISMNRFAEVTKAFNDGETIICSQRRERSGNRYIEIHLDDDWRIDGLYFIDDEGIRFIAHQCLVK